MGARDPDIPSYALYGERYGSPFPDCLHLETIAERSRLHDWHIRPHRHHGLHQFIWIARGEVTASSDGARHAFAAPAALMVAPTSVHGFAFEPDTEGVVVTVPTVNLERSLPGSTALLGRLDRPILVRCGDDGEAPAAGVQALFDAITAEYRGREEGRTEALLCQAGLLALWFLRAADRREAGGAGARPRGGPVRGFLALVEEHYRDHRPLRFYADRLGITATHLSRACRRRFGLSAQAILLDRLVLEAKRLLAYTPAPVAEIARELGFRDPAYFARFFAHHVGESPTRFRRPFLG